MRPLIVYLGIVLSISGYSATIKANPVSCEVFRARQVPGSTHVQITFAETCGENLKILSLKRDSEIVKPDWQLQKGFVANTGSGLRTMNADQTCDCDVELGEHEFKLAYKITADDGEVYQDDFTRTVDVQKLEDPAQQAAQADDSKDAGETSEFDAGEEMPWAEPEPEEVQGLDCVSACKNGGPGTEAAASEDNSGCTIISGKNDGTGLVLLLITSLALWIRGKTHVR